MFFVVYSNATKSDFSIKSVGLEEGDITVHTLSENTSYSSKPNTEKTQLQSYYNNLGPSTPQGLADSFKGQIASKLTNSIKNNLINPGMSYGVNALTSKMFATQEAAVKELRVKVQTDRNTRDRANTLANANAKKAKQEAKAKRKEERDKAKGKNNKKAPKEKTPVELNEHAKKGLEKLEQDGNLRDTTELALASGETGRPVYVYDENGKLKYVVGDDLPGEPFLVKHILPTSDNPGHFTPLDKSLADKVIPSGKNNCALDSLMVQMSPDERESHGIHSADDLKKKMIDTLRNNPEEANDAFQMRDRLAEIAPDRVIDGGAALSAMAKAGMAADAWLDRNPDIKNLIDKGIDVANVAVLLKTAPALFTLAWQSPAIFAAIVATTAVAYTLVNDIYEKVIQETGLRTEEVHQKIGNYLKTIDSDLTNE
ncbi:hypothetical protein [Cardinium endosymbiont of Culicoides punctatus]|uniref:hypothetical protein n=1 Tax=Cardinium endosymbiont of Culicoides punctatus TaxID=2304601 RepID=UPI001059015C|nr:hypothetical protein [Cardinium endosymbiont of Culicoides punctatus]TDG95407.1 hypothetical protein CCPUN_03830 [Cardinium endosymbiont of Culicoides punctatus]